MSILTGNNGVVKIANASGTKTPVAAIRNFTIDITSDTIEKTTMGNDTRQFVRGLSSWSGSADIYFDPDNYTGGTNVIAALNPASSLSAVGDAAIALEVYLDGSNNKFAGDIIVTGYSVKSSMDGMVEASISFQGSNTLAFTA